jgi:hypothetical protein
MRVGRAVRDAWIVAAGVFLLAASFTAYFGWNRLRVDATAYWRAAASLRTGAPLYAAEPVAALDKAYLYPPAFAAAFAPLTTLPPLWGYAVWMALEVVLAVALARTCATLAGLDGAAERQRDRRRTALALALAAGVVPVFDNLVEGQVNLLVTWLAAVAVRDAERGADRRAAFALAAAAHVKLVPIVLAGAFLVWRRTRLLAWLAVALVVVALLPLGWRVASLGIGPGLAAFAADYADFWSRIVWPGASARRVAGVEQLFAPNVSIHATLARLFDDVALSPFPALAERRGPLLLALPSAAVTALSAGLGLAALAAALGLCAHVAADPGRRIAAAGLVLVAGALASPSCWQHHLVVLAIAGAGLWRVAARSPGPPRRRRLALAATPLVAAMTVPFVPALVSQAFENGLYRDLREWGVPTLAAVAFYLTVLAGSLRAQGANDGTQSSAGRSRSTPAAPN